MMVNRRKGSQELNLDFFLRFSILCFQGLKSMIRNYYGFVRFRNRWSKAINRRRCFRISVKTLKNYGKNVCNGVNKFWYWMVKNCERNFWASFMIVRFLIIFLLGWCVCRFEVILSSIYIHKFQNMSWKSIKNLKT